MGSPKLTSLDYARLIQYGAQKFHCVMLNKTQVNKILFCVYGVYLAKTGERLFENEHPEAWIYGPVFPTVYRNIDVDKIIRFNEGEIKLFNSNQTALNIVREAIDALYRKSAATLTRWSHQKGSPWYKTIYILNKDRIVGQHPWGKEIQDGLIRDYFSNPNNAIS